MGSTVTADEWQVRCDLAACYRLVDMFGWSDLINTRITARVPGAQDHFLINPYGLLFDEITASSLVKIDAHGDKVEPSEAPVNIGGFAIPSAIHMARPTLACVLHSHTVAGCAVSMQKDGLLPLNQHALQVIGDVAYHDYEGTGRSSDERSRLLADLGDPLQEYEAKIAALERMVGRQALEIELLKGALKPAPRPRSASISVVTGPATSRSAEDAS
jgi:ribulose-5-phosphate 4-epimerase/fuculose-1-phosphate aldolase